MLEIVTYGVCVAITIVLIIVLLLFSGSSVLFLLILFPSILAGWISREKVAFMTNSSPRHSTFFYVLTVFFAGIEVMLAAGILYVIYKVIAVLSPTASQVIEAPPALLSKGQISGLLILNVVLAIFTVYQTIMTGFNFFRFRKKIKEMSRYMVVMGYILPILVFPIALWFLFESYNLLSAYFAKTSLGLPWQVQVAGVLCIIYQLVGLGWNLHTYFTILKRHNVKLGFSYWSGTGLMLLYKIAFTYFAITMFLVQRS